MDVLLWVAQVFLAWICLMAGVSRLRLAALRDTVEVRQAMAGRSIVVWLLLAALDLAVAVALVLPWAFQVVPVLTPVAAVVDAVGTAVVWVRRSGGTGRMLVPSLLMIGLDLLVAVGRWSQL
ncbi:hypothetical protein ACI2K4_04115 [Micromonospora sp. NPDC050397]|uniref:hypothetical protein n=1 Tax=Micromonospora sp. NPDC050397 TaxID=3364279 RepID=UPI00384F1B10